VGRSEDSAHDGTIGLALEPLAWQISRPGGERDSSVKDATQWL